MIFMAEETLKQLRKELNDAIKNGQVFLMWYTPKGHPQHGATLLKIAGLEKTVRGIDEMLAGGTSQTVQEGFDQIIKAVDSIVNKVHPSILETIYAERAMYLGMKDKFAKLDDLLALPDDDDDNDSSEPEDNHLLN